MKRLPADLKEQLEGHLDQAYRESGNGEWPSDKWDWDLVLALAELATWERERDDYEPAELLALLKADAEDYGLDDKSQLGLNLEAPVELYLLYQAVVPYLEEANVAFGKAQAYLNSLYQ
jgi:hypothetical protein